MIEDFNDFLNFIHVYTVSVYGNLVRIKDLVDFSGLYSKKVIRETN